MRNLPLFWSAALLAVIGLGSLAAQPTDQMIRDTAAKTKTERTESTASKAQIEAEYLARAKAGIERYRKGDAALQIVDAQGRALSGVKVEINQVSQDFLFGNIVFELALFEPAGFAKADEFKARFKALFNLAVLPFYWGPYEETPGHPAWQRNEAALAWCLANGITCKGHPLAWTSPAGTPGWLLQLPEASTEAALQARIQSLVMGYKGRIALWDVVNEAANTIPWDRAIQDKTNADSVRYQVRGVSPEQVVPWVDRAFRWAQEANPDAHYILNEYFTLAVPEVRERFRAIIAELMKSGAPVKGIGIQAHEPREMWFSPVEVYKTFDLYAQFGLPIHITELIPQSSGKAITGWREGTWTQQAQAEFAEQFYTLAFGHPAVASINWWGLSDANIWLPGGGLLDADYEPKPVYNTLMRLIKKEWMTRDLSLQSDAKGELAFRGFWGDYEITVTKADGSRQSFRRHLGEKGERRWTLELAELGRK